MHSNLVNSKSSGLEILFRVISSSNYWDVDVKIDNPKMIIFSFFHQTYCKVVFDSDLQVCVVFLKSL